MFSKRQAREKNKTAGLTAKKITLSEMSGGPRVLEDLPATPVLGVVAVRCDETHLCFERSGSPGPHGQHASAERERIRFARASPNIDSSSW